MHLTYRLRMDNFYLIHECIKSKFRVYLNHSDKDLVSKFVELNRNPISLKKFLLVIEAVKLGSANRTQYNWEQDFSFGSVYAIKVDQHRFYTLQKTNFGFKELYICRYNKKESQTNTKKIQSTIDSIEFIEIQKILCNE